MAHDPGWPTPRTTARFRPTAKWRTMARIARACRWPPGWRLPIRFLAGADNPEAEATRPTTVHNNGDARGRTAAPIVNAASG